MEEPDNTKTLEQFEAERAAKRAGALFAVAKEDTSKLLGQFAKEKVKKVRCAACCGCGPCLGVPHPRPPDCHTRSQHSLTSINPVSCHAG